METAKHRHYVIIIILLALGSVLVALQPATVVTAETGVDPVLPERVGDYLGDDSLYCQDPDCLNRFSAADVAGKTCPDCGGTWNLRDSAGTFNDTRVMRKQGERDVAVRVRVG